MDSKSKISNEVLRKQAWDYFQMQAGQRLTTFNFYIVISSVLTTALIASLKGDLVILHIGVALGFLLSLISFIFSKLDERNKELIKGAEEVIKFFEGSSSLPDSGSEPHIAKKFLREEYDTELKKSQRSWRFWKNYYSYSDCFRVVFLTFGTIGVAGGVLALWKLI